MVSPCENIKNKLTHSSNEIPHMTLNFSLLKTGTDSSFFHQDHIVFSVKNFIA